MSLAYGECCYMCQFYIFALQNCWWLWSHSQALFKFQIFFRFIFDPYRWHFSYNFFFLSFDANISVAAPFPRKSNSVIWCVCLCVRELESHSCSPAWNLEKVPGIVCKNACELKTTGFPIVLVIWRLIASSKINKDGLFKLNPDCHSCHRPLCCWMLFSLDCALWLPSMVVVVILDPPNSSIRLASIA